MHARLTVQVQRRLHFVRFELCEFEMNVYLHSKDFVSLKYTALQWKGRSWNTVPWSLFSHISKSLQKQNIFTILFQKNIINIYWGT
jgi:hypothetical protein